ncbi:MAG: diacylglycerol kinase family protein [Parcubacteria group bacterium]|nr:diacylglycerol kinase family protein [Parcubacteria group bacterium]
MKKRVHIISFKHAWDGIWYSLTTQPNFQVHVIAAFAVIFAAWYFQVTKVEWIMLLFAIALVFVAEMLNTAIESVTDILILEFNKHAKIAKDVAAGMVLLSAVFAVVVGLIIFFPYLASF